MDKLPINRIIYKRKNENEREGRAQAEFISPQPTVESA